MAVSIVELNVALSGLEPIVELVGASDERRGLGAFCGGRVALLLGLTTGALGALERRSHGRGIGLQIARVDAVAALQLVVDAFAGASRGGIELAPGLAWRRSIATSGGIGRSPRTSHAPGRRRQVVVMQRDAPGAEFASRPAERVPPGIAHGPQRR